MIPNNFKNPEFKKIILLNSKYNSYNMENQYVAIAIVKGIIDKSEVDPEAYQELLDEVDQDPTHIFWG